MLTVSSTGSDLALCCTLLSKYVRAGARPPPLLGGSDHSVGLRPAAGLEARAPSSPPVPARDPPAAWRRGASGRPLAPPAVPFARLALSPALPRCSLGRGKTPHGCWRAAPQPGSRSRAHRQHPWEEPPPPAFLADLADAAAGAPRRERTGGALLPQHAHRSSRGVCAGLLNGRLPHRRNGDRWLTEPALHGCGRVPGGQVRWHSTQRMLRQRGGRLDRSSGATPIGQIDASNGPFGPAPGVQPRLSRPPAPLPRWYMWARIRL